MRLKIMLSNLEFIKRHGESEYPFECCGFLIGQTLDNLKSVFSTLPVENSREIENRHNRYLIPPQNYMEAERLARAQNLDIIGFYHSHPDAEARPSQFDLDHSWPVYSYLIVSVINGKASKVTSWQLKEDRSAFFSEKLIETPL
jgi:proteasome lid subunit RPN8/RPN11